MSTALLLSLVTFLAPRPLHVSGTKILDDSGRDVRFHGVNIPSLEWTAAGDHVMDSVRVAIDDWHANLIRVPLSEDRWFGKAPDSKDDGTDYRKVVDAVVSAVNERGMHVLLDLHWSNAGSWGQNIGQHNLPDAGSLAFWTACAGRFANNPAVLFDLYNEPINGPWDTWRDGGPITETFNGKQLSYQAIGMQTLLEAIRGVGAKNVVVAGGLGYASRFDGFPAHLLSDKGGAGVVYADHFYPGWESVAAWEPRITAAAQKWPILIGEFGADPQSLPLGYPKRQTALTLAQLPQFETAGGGF